MQGWIPYYENHCHTPLCKHAIGHPDEYIATAKSERLSGITFTCHNPMPDGFSPEVRMERDEFETYVSMLESASRKEQEIDVRIGIEADYFPGYEDWLTEQLKYPFSYVIGSVHPQLEMYEDAYLNWDAFEFQKAYFSHLADAAETGLFDCISHPDLVKNHPAHGWEAERIMPFICNALDRIASTGVAMELNTSGALKAIPEMNPFPAMLVEMRKRDIAVVVGSDAHLPQRVGDRFQNAFDLLQEAGYKKVSMFVERKRRDVLIDDLKS